jgi:hypothetical protein
VAEDDDSDIEIISVTGTVLDRSCPTIAEGDNFTNIEYYS